MTGLERNSDLVFSAAYAPLLGSESNTEWTPNLITFSPNTVVRSTSYYVEQMFAGNYADTILPGGFNLHMVTIESSTCKGNIELIFLLPFGSFPAQKPSSLLRRFTSNGHGYNFHQGKSSTNNGA